MNHPPVVSREAWRAARDALLLEEKALTRATDALAARRRRMPMTEITEEYFFDSPRGRLRLLDLFEDRAQLIVYHHMLKAGSSHLCPGCSLFSDNLGRLEHVNARDTTFAAVSRATLEQIAQVKTRMGYSFPWYACVGGAFTEDLVRSHEGTPFGLMVFMRQGERVFQTYFTAGRGVETASNTFQLLDLTPWGRQETWQEAPAGWPQQPAHSRLRLHDEYGKPG